MSWTHRHRPLSLLWCWNARQVASKPISKKNGPDTMKYNNNRNEIKKMERNQKKMKSLGANPKHRELETHVVLAGDLFDVDTWRNGLWRPKQKQNCPRSKNHSSAKSLTDTFSPKTNQNAKKLAKIVTKMQDNLKCVKNSKK